MKSQASATTLVGGGRRAPGSEHRSCQTNRVIASTIRGGSTTFAICRAISPTRSSAGRIGGWKATISAERTGASGTGMSAVSAIAVALLAAAITPPS